MKAVITLASYTAAAIGLLTFFTLSFGTGFFTSDIAVQQIVRNTAPLVSLAVIQAILAVALDGAMLASRDFSFIIVVGLFTLVMQLGLLGRCGGLSAIFVSFAMRLGV
eukprot:CAMPEP_0113951432 /NCGR_PEP_ID=MMETSP1339-20121228/86094_1 /TAXON_ID=94617 /ORGANISM="Fibrocapsa japonica" /LENGTH=107 /DNA_ID=CAMNT_0000959677 /DNA_START=15 /DNA_END=335 /DNA_ORIENTATION=- /assembly_acc=CAM_ASM_000762